MCSEGSATCLEILIALLLPPLGVFFRYGCCSVEFCISVLLTILGYVPGMIYAVYVILAVDREKYRGDYYQPINA